MTNTNADDDDMLRNKKRSKSISVYPAEVGGKTGARVASGVSKSDASGSEVRKPASASVHPAP